MSSERHASASWVPKRVACSGHTLPVDAKARVTSLRLKIPNIPTQTAFSLRFPFLSGTPFRSRLAKSRPSLEQESGRHLRYSLFRARRGQVWRVKPRLHQSRAVEEVETRGAVLKLLPRIVVLVLHLCRHESKPRKSAREGGVFGKSVTITYAW